MAEQETPSAGGPPGGRAVPAGPRGYHLASNIGDVALCLIAIVFSSELHVALGYAMYTEQALAAACAPRRMRSI